MKRFWFRLSGQRNQESLIQAYKIKNDELTRSPRQDFQKVLMIQGKVYMEFLHYARKKLQRASKRAGLNFLGSIRFVSIDNCAKFC